MLYDDGAVDDVLYDDGGVDDVLYDDGGLMMCYERHVVLTDAVVLT